MTNDTKISISSLESLQRETRSHDNNNNTASTTIHQDGPSQDGRVSTTANRLSFASARAAEGAFPAPNPNAEPLDPTTHPNTLPLNTHQNADIRSLHSANPQILNRPVSKSAWHQLFGKSPFKTSYFSLYRPIRTVKERCILVLAVILSMAGGVPLPIIGVLFGKMINTFPPEPEDLKIKLAQLMGVAVAYFCITWGWATCWGVIGERVSRGLREAVLEKAVGMDVGWFEVAGVDIAQRLTADTQTIQLGTSEKTGLFIQSIAYFLAAFITGFVLNPRLTGILFAAVIPAMAFVVITGSRIVSRYAKRANEMAQKGSVIAEGSISAVRVVQAFGAAERLVGEYTSFLSEAARIGIIRSIAGAVMLGSVYFVAYCANALAFWEGSRLVARGSSEGAGTVYTVVFLILDASFVIGSFGPFIQTFALAAAAGEKILKILDTPNPVIDTYSSEGESVPEGNNDIHLENITFVYPSRPTVRVLDGVNLTIPAGRATALVGPSGSGKSTIAGLLLRFYDPAYGSVRIGTTDIRDINLPKYRSKIALVEQDPILFSGTILENIQHGLMSRDDFSELTEEVKRELAIAAAKDANAHDFISNLPKGFDTVIGGASSTELSGGQKQRITLARALIAEPRLLVLDEPTSALDSTSEAAILEALGRAREKEGRTIVMIAHRLATVKDADKIVVLAQGKVVEEGDHRGLMEKGGAYKALVEAQGLSSSSSSSQESLVSMDTKVVDSSEDLGGEDEKKGGLGAAESKYAEAREYSAKELIRRCLRLSKPDVKWILLGLCASMVSGGIILGESIIFGNLISILNNRTDKTQMLKDASFFSLLFFILAVIALLAFVTSGTSFGIVSERLILRVRSQSLHSILRQDIDWFCKDGNSASGLMSKLNMDAGHLSGLSGVILGTIFSVLTSMIGGILLAHIVAWKIAVVLLAAVPVMLVSGFLRLRILSKFEERHQTAYVGAASLATEAINAIKTIQALGREKDVVQLYRAAVAKPYSESLRFIIHGNLWLAFALAITYFVYALAYWWGATNVRTGEYSTLQFFIVLPALLFSAQASGQMFSLAPEVTRAKTAARSVFGVLDTRPSIDCGEPLSSGSSFDDEKKPGSDSDSSGSSSPSTLTPSSALITQPTPIAATGASITLRSVSFHYPSRPTHPILSSLSLHIPSGSFTALVGSSGAGKSTVLSLIARFYDPTSGSVLIDGKDVRSVDVRKHRERVGLVQQEACLFPGNIRFNVGLGAPPGKAEEWGEQGMRKEVERVCKMVGMHEFIMSLPEGYETDCTPTASTPFSGGQTSRLSLARALLRNPSLLLLDEATASLDSHSEALVQASINEARKGRTCVVVAHRLSTVRNADWIWVFESGRVVEGGRHEELVRMEGVYAGMWRRQEVG